MLQGKSVYQRKAMDKRRQEDKACFGDPEYRLQVLLHLRTIIVQKTLREMFASGAGCGSRCSRARERTLKSRCCPHPKMTRGRTLPSSRWNSSTSLWWWQLKSPSQNPRP